jgi:hypothetical protein
MLPIAKLALIEYSFLNNQYFKTYGLKSGPKTAPRAPTPPRQTTHTCRKEKQSAQKAKPEKAFLGKEKHMHFAATRRRE